MEPNHMIYDVNCPKLSNGNCPRVYDCLGAGTSFNNIIRGQEPSNSGGINVSQ
jgi:hypothetical protein